MRSAYHAVLAVKWGAPGFRGINGRLPAKTRVPSIYSTTRCATPDRCARRDLRDAGNPAQEQSRGYDHECLP
jgi:hypothetical protein